MGTVVDIETLGTVDLTKVGQVNYARHKDTMISVLAWKVPETGKTYSLVHPKLATKIPDEETIEAFLDFLSSSGYLIAHNASFEMEVFNYKLEDFAKAVGVDYTMSKKYTLSRFIDTQTLSNIFKGPGSLQAAGNYFGLKIEKDVVGKNIMKAVCTGKTKKPRSLKTTAKKVPASWVEIDGIWYKAGLQVYDILEKYCRQDVETTALLFEVLKEKEQDLGGFAEDTRQGMWMTQDINERGVLTDLKWRERLGDLRDNIYDKLDKHSMKSFGFLPGQRARLKEAINATGYVLEGVGRPAIEKSFRDNEGHEKIKADLKVYTDLNKTSLNKVDAIQRQVNPETGILKHMFRYCGATATGRFTSMGVQLQNLPRPKHDFSIKECEDMIDSTSVDYDPEEIVSGIRGVFIPRPGYKFFIADLSQIELRRMMVKAGYLDKQQYLVDGGDLYADLASSFFKKKITKGDWERQKVGKPFLLALNYGLGSARLMEQYETEVGEKITMEQADEYRSINKQLYPKIPFLWNKYGAALDQAFHKKQDFKVKLSSGRYINYGKIVKRKFLQKGREHVPVHERIDTDYYTQKCHYDGTRGWLPLYGSLIFQNVIQAECRDILLIKMNALHSQGAKIVMTVHDEVIVEVPKDKTLDECSNAWYNAGMERVKELFPSMIIDSDCVFTDRYWSH